ncbi:MAG: metal-sensitive transcriptional regulator [Gammaproteobacteria bacterium]
MNHPCHKKQIASIRRIKGQIEGIERMIENGKYCIDILNQIKATKNAITAVEGNILQTHLEECIKESLNGAIDANQKIDEIVKVLKR